MQGPAALGPERDLGPLAGADVEAPQLPLGPQHQIAVVGPVHGRVGPVQGEALHLVAGQPVRHHPPRAGGQIEGLEQGPIAIPGHEHQRGAVGGHRRPRGGSGPAGHGPDVPGGAIQADDPPQPADGILVVLEPSPAARQVDHRRVRGPHLAGVGVVVEARQGEAVPAVEVALPHLGDPDAAGVDRAAAVQQVRPGPIPHRVGAARLLVVGERHRLAGGQIEDPHVLVASAVGGEGEAGAVGGEAGLHVEGGALGEAGGDAPGQGDGPQVAE